MRVEIIGVSLQEGIVRLSCIDCSDEHIEWIERTRDDGFQREIEFLFNSKNKTHFASLRKWMKKQSCTQGKATWGEAIHSLLGTITDTYGIGRYRVWE